MNLQQRNNLRGSLILLIATVFLMIGRTRAQEPEPPPTKDHPIVEMDLQKLGFERYENPRTRWPIFVDFTDANSVALAWLTPVDRVAAKKVGVLTPAAALLHVLVLDAATGKQRGTGQWPTPSVPVRFLGLRDGRFLTCTGGVLRLFSAGFEVLRERNLPNDHSCLKPVRGGVSPSRKTLLLSVPTAQNNGRTSLTDSLLDVDTFGTLATWTESPVTTDISDHWMVGRCGRPPEFCIRDFDQPWKPFPLDSKTVRAVDFVDNEKFAVGSGNDILLMNVSGESLFQLNVPEHRLAVRFFSSQDGERFAAMEGRMRGLRSEPLDMYPFLSIDRIVVYSIPDRSAIYTIKIKGASPWPGWHSEGHLNEVALSPDGKLLALVADSVLKVYRLP